MWGTDLAGVYEAFEMHHGKPAYFNKDKQVWLYSTKYGDWLFDTMKYADQQIAGALPSGSHFDCPNNHPYQTSNLKGEYELNPCITVNCKHYRLLYF